MTCLLVTCADKNNQTQQLDANNIRYYVAALSKRERRPSAPPRSKQVSLVQAYRTYTHLYLWWATTFCAGLCFSP